MNAKGAIICLKVVFFIITPGIYGSELVEPSVASFSSNHFRYYLSVYEKSKEAHRKSPADIDTALRFAKACFDLAEFATNSAHRAQLATDGIEVCKEILKTNSLNGEAHYWLAMNYAQLSRTKGWSALKIVNEMEKEYLKAIEINPAMDNAGPHRYLGLLYRDAPGWPVSIGSKAKARKHLEEAVRIAPDFPDNQLFLVETYLKWSEKKLAQEQFLKAKEVIRSARQKYNGDEWHASWEDWDNRLKKIEAKLKVSN